MFWWWRSARSEMIRRYKRKLRQKKTSSISALSFDLVDKNAETVLSRMLEKAVDGLTSDERFFLLGSSMAETEKRGLTRSQYEIRRRQVRRKIAGEL